MNTCRKLACMTLGAVICCAGMIAEKVITPSAAYNKGTRGTVRGLQ